MSLIVRWGLSKKYYCVLKTVLWCYGKTGSSFLNHGYQRPGWNKQNFFQCWEVRQMVILYYPHHLKSLFLGMQLLLGIVTFLQVTTFVIALWMLSFPTSPMDTFTFSRVISMPVGTTVEALSNLYMVNSLNFFNFLKWFSVSFYQKTGRKSCFFVGALAFFFISLFFP